MRYPSPTHTDSCRWRRRQGSERLHRARSIPETPRARVPPRVRVVHRGMTPGLRGVKVDAPCADLIERMASRRGGQGSDSDALVAHAAVRRGPRAVHWRQGMLHAVDAFR